MSSPIMPDNTCPIIDKAISIFEAVQDGNVKVCDIRSEVGRVIDILDDSIRKANERLRECANYWKDEAADWRRNYEDTTQ